MPGSDDDHATCHIEDLTLSALWYFSLHFAETLVVLPNLIVHLTTWSLQVGVTLADSVLLLVGTADGCVVIFQLVRDMTIKPDPNAEQQPLRTRGTGLKVQRIRLVHVGSGHMRLHLTPSTAESAAKAHPQRVIALSDKGAVLTFPSSLCNGSGDNVGAFSLQACMNSCMHIST